ncbi:MAG: hypothetical protein PHU51_02640 [Candidatus Nanoarchaeia archaeon]|nr:hypothetical protein [Candidatus Nanoarchaeia archaeon]
MEYQATFGIDCGVSPGYGVKYPDNVKRTETLLADSPQDAYQNAMGLAKNFADDYLSNPDNGFTTVQLLSLRGSEGNVSFDASKSVVKRSMLEHLLALASESAPDE